ncbi:MAG: chlorite dismutase family protein [Blastocatellia bacterium]|nr:chlorite dismutase family protein [Blastocatellia bacterium]
MPVEIVNSRKDHSDGSGLRLVEGPKTTASGPEVEKQFVNFMFFRMSPDWRRIESDKKEQYQREFETVFNEFHDDLLLFSYSLVGFDSKADLMLWRIGTSLDTIQEMTARLYRTNLGSYLVAADNHLAITKKMMFVSNSSEDRFHVGAGEKQYHFVYPCAKHKDWYEKTIEERDALVEENFMVGRKFPNIKIHMTHAFGFSEQEYIISFETDEPRDFLALAEELRQTPGNKLSLRGMPVYTCRQRPLIECLEALG